MNCQLCPSLENVIQTYSLKKFKSDTLTAHAWLYDFERVKKMIWDSKYRGNFIHYQHQSMLMACVVLDLQNIYCSQFQITYVPTIERHVKARGYDHSFILAKSVARQLRKSVDKTLIACHHTSQVKKAQRSRFINPFFEPITDISRSDYILIDDVASTRSTLYRASQTLINRGANKVVALTLCMNKKF